MKQNEACISFEKNRLRQRAPKYHAPAPSPFYQALKRDINEYFRHSGRAFRGSGFMFFKITIFLATFVICYVNYIDPLKPIKEWFAWCLGLGISSMLVGLNIGHDAVHKALFKQNWLNRAASFSFDLIGVSSYMWNLKHNLLHHNYPNVPGVDMDIEAAPLLRLSPEDQLKWYHRFQHIYAPLVYTLFSLNLLLINDLALLSRIRREDIDGKPHPPFIFLEITLFKLFNIFYMLIIPLLVLPFEWWQILGGFASMHAILSLLLASVLLPAHLFECSFYSTNDKKGILYEAWAEHQVRTTLDFAPGSSLMNFFFGGFNTNVVHHLFPRICHCHYKPLTRIVKSNAAKYQVPYHETTLAGAIRQHFRALKILGTQNQF